MFLEFFEPWLKRFSVARKTWEKGHLLSTDPEESSWTFFLGGWRNLNQASSTVSVRVLRRGNLSKKGPQTFLDHCTTDGTR